MLDKRNYANPVNHELIGMMGLSGSVTIVALLCQRPDISALFLAISLALHWKVSNRGNKIRARRSAIDAKVYQA